MTAIVGTRKTKEQAGPPPEPGHVWSEDLQRWIPLGQQLAIDRREREEDPAHQLAQYDRRRTAIVHFVAEKLVEDEYEDGGGLVDGRLNDYYAVPGSSWKALTKRGAEKLGDLFRFRRANSRVTASNETPEHVSARVLAELVDSFGQPAGSHEAACSTAEKGFRSPRARLKYGAVGQWQAQGRRRVWVETSPPDYRAALNDVVARAGKRAFVGAVIVACAADEIFEVAAEETGEVPEASSQRPPAKAAPRPAAAPRPQASGARGPVMRLGQTKGTPLVEVETADLERAVKWCRTKDPKKFATAITEMEEELEMRRAADLDGEGPA